MGVGLNLREGLSLVCGCPPASVHVLPLNPLLHKSKHPMIEAGSLGEAGHRVTSSFLGEPKLAEGTKEETLRPVMEMTSFPLEVVRIRAQG